MPTFYYGYKSITIFTMQFELEKNRCYFQAYLKYQLHNPDAYANHSCHNRISLKKQICFVFHYLDGGSKMSQNVASSRKNEKYCCLLKLSLTFTQIYLGLPCTISRKTGYVAYIAYVTCLRALHKIIGVDASIVIGC